jgi:hypothetical protein
MDGPVVRAAIKALEMEDVNLVLPYVQKDGEEEILRAFKDVIQARKAGGAAKIVADRYFFETVVRVHRAGEGAPYTGLKPVGLDVGPVIPIAEQAIETNIPDDLVQVLTDAVRLHVRERFARVMDLKRHANGHVAESREYVQAMLGLQVYSHQLYLAATAEAHEEGHQHE